MSLRLNPSNLAAANPGTAVPAYDRRAMTLGIVHIGPGAFHRAHQASYVDALLHTDPRWAISALSLKSPGVRDALAPQDGLFTLAEMSEQRRLRIIGAIREVLVATEDLERAFTRLTAAESRLVTLTVTEKGYCLDPTNALDEAHPDIIHDRQHPETPRSVVGWLTEALRRRRANGIAPFAVVSCDNLANNGATLRKAVVAFAAHRSADLARWIEDTVEFPRTMVDSITPATDDSLRELVARATGLVDAWPIQREPFTQWVVEDTPAMREADWTRVGVTLTNDVGLYERAKLRLLNGAHSTLAYVGTLLGHETVLEASTDPMLAAFVEQMMRNDIAPTLGDTGDFDVSSYIDAVLARFRNRGMRHLLSQIAWDGSKKLPVRIMGTIADALQANRPVDRLLVPIAAWMRFVVRQARAGVPLVDPDANALAAVGASCTGEARHDVAAFASMQTVIAPALWQTPAFRDALLRAYALLATPGFKLNHFMTPTS
jgi:fructuronate reductase